MALPTVRHPFLQVRLPAEGSTMYSARHESDACGMGAIVHLHGERSHEILAMSLESVCNMLHRGAVDADMKTGDGSGVLTQLPYALIRRELARLGVTDIPAEDERLAVGVFFTPDPDSTTPHPLHTLAEEIVSRRGLRILAWRPVPVHPDQLGVIAQKSRPRVEHLYLAAPADWDATKLERQLYLTRRELERAIRISQQLPEAIPAANWDSPVSSEGNADQQAVNSSQRKPKSSSASKTKTKTTKSAKGDKAAPSSSAGPDYSGCYLPSFSSRLISYKGLAMPAALRTFYADLTDPDYTTAIALYHQRFSTNTFPAWPLGQPFRMLCHNGEINTIDGNRNWEASREEFFASEAWGDEIELVKDLMQEGESDSASLDHALELLVLSGRSLEHAMCLLVPPAYRNQPHLSPETRAFYQYTRSFSEPWDGPAALVYTDGVKVCASLDRNGLRPSRFKLRDDGLLFIGSEVGTIPMDDARIVAKGRLGPGQMLSANTENGQLRFDAEIKEEIARAKPYRHWVEQNRVELSHFTPKGAQRPTEDLSGSGLLRAQLITGYTKEDLDMVFPPMIKSGQEAVYSMGTDTPLSILSRQPRSLPSFFKQLFAQVTNPPIDPIRERAVMSLAAGLGPERNLLDETPEHARILNLESAVLYEHELEALSHREREGFPSVTLDATWELDEGEDGLRAALVRLCTEAEEAVDNGVTILILSDRNLSERRVPVPSMLAVGAVHTHLIRARKRLRASLVADSAEARDTHSMACLFGYGVTAVCPWLGYSTVRSIVAANPNDYKDTTPLEAVANYRTAMEKGLLKIMSKMGISVLNSYQGAHNFAAIGIGQEVIDFCFPGTESQVSGIGFAGIARECLRRHAAAFAAGSELGDYGFNRYKKDGELHSLAPATIKNFHTFVKNNEEKDYDHYVSDLLEANPVGIKHLFEFVPAESGPISLDEVEPIEAIRRRFTTAAMSLGALSPEAHETLAIAMNAIGAKSDSGEGGEDSERFQPYENGEWARSAIKQVASGRFGVTAEYLRNCQEIEIKMAQGAKPGEGGQLPAHKVNGIIARLRRTQPGVQLISPPPHHDIYSIEDLSQLIHDLKEINPKARITVKLVASSGVGTVAAGVAKANADTILISGHEGGTAASPLSSIHHAGLPWEMGLAEAQQTLVINGLREKVLLRTDGGLRTGQDIVKAAILGAEEFNFGTIAMIAMGCVYVRRCHLNDCPVGVATMDPKFRAKFRGRPEHVINFFNAVAEEVREILASLGVRSIDELIGRPKFLRQRSVPDHPKANSLDLTRLLADPASSVEESGEPEPARKWNGGRNVGINPPPLDLEFIEAAQPALERREAVMIERSVVNTNRDLGTRLAGEVAERYGDHGLAEGTILIQLSGSAGQSLGAFLCSGIDLRLEGEANDYVGKGMTAGQIVVRAPELRGFVPAENQIVGNTCLYGSTGGRLFANGRAGERFGVRNSGGIGVIEGLGDHGCEYMTNGLVVVLGPTGINFGAGMSGGKAYVLDHDGRFSSRCNLELIEVQPLRREADKDELKHLIEAHASLTGSEVARELLTDWDRQSRRFVRVLPKTSAEAERIESATENAGKPEAVA